MNILFRVGAVGLLLLTNLSSWCQTKTVVKFDLDKKQALEAIPFDEPFLIEASISKDVKLVEFKYRIKSGDYESWHYLPSMVKDAYSPTTTWKQRGEVEVFHVDCGSLHPNVTYEFLFTTREQISLTTDKRKELNVLMLQQLKLFFSQSGIIAAMIQQLRTDLNTLAKQAVNKPGTLVDIGGNTFVAGPFTPPLKAVNDKINDVVTKKQQAHASADASAAVNDLVTNAAIRTAFETTLYNIANNRLTLHAIAKNLLSIPVDPTIPEFSSFQG